MYNIGIIGATGYVGIEIIRLLQNHPQLNISAVASQNFAGKKISEVYPSLNHVFEMECSEPDIDNLAGKADIFVTALPHGVSKEIIPKLAAKGRRVLDHSGDFRYKSVEVYEKWYSTVHGMPELLNKAVYGLPELYRDKIAEAGIVGNPGCYPTCSILGLAPVLHNHLIEEKSIIVDAASGITGAGRKAELEYSFCECMDNYKAYNVAKHRHTSEIEQEYSILAGKEVVISFTPHLLPVKRGMLCTIYANLRQNSTTGELLDIYKEYYRDEYFVRVLDEGKLPEIKNVNGSNFIDIGLIADTRTNRVIVVSALDNLGKGSAGQAVQDLNIMCGLPESMGIESSALYL